MALVKYSTRLKIDRGRSIHFFNFLDQILSFQLAKTHTKPQPISMKMTEYVSLGLMNPKITNKPISHASKPASPVGVCSP